MYQRAKGQADKRPFGTQLDVQAAGYEWINHSMAPTDVPTHDFRVTIGAGGTSCTQPYEASVFNISGMSFGVIVVEAELRSGSLITARLANEQGREVFAVPGSPLDPRSAGPNKLIRDGATLITSAADVLEALGPVLSGQIPTLPEPFMAPISHFEDGEGLAGTLRDRIISLLGPTPIEIDDLIRESGAGAAAVMTVLLELELAGRLSRHGRQRVSLNPGG